MGEKNLAKRLSLQMAGSVLANIFEDLYARGILRCTLSPDMVELGRFAAGMVRQSQLEATQTAQNNYTAPHPQPAPTSQTPIQVEDN